MFEVVYHCSCSLVSIFRYHLSCFAQNGANFTEVGKMLERIMGEQHGRSSLRAVPRVPSKLYTDRQRVHIEIEQSYQLIVIL